MKYSYKKVHKVHLIEMDNEIGLKVYLSRIGASIYAIYFNDELMTLTPENLSDFFKANAYYGKTIGPIAGRVKNGEINIDGKSYFLKINEEDKALHGGKNGISNANFDVANIHNKNGKLTIILRYIPRKLHSELPGKIAYQVAYTINDQNCDLEVSLSAMSTEDCVFALTNHAYFTLNEPNVNGLELTVPSHRFIETDKDSLLPLKEREILPCLDFNAPKPIGKDINNPFLMEHRAKGYDHAYILDKKLITLQSKKYKLNITTDFDSVVIYSDNYADGIKMKNIGQEDHRGIAIEPQDNQLNRPLIKKGNYYAHEIKYSFSKK